MVEEVQEKEIASKLSEAECKAFYELVTKKDLSDEEKAQIKAVMAKNPQILAQKEFTEHLKLTDFAFTCSKPEDLPAALEAHSKDIELLNQALANLKDYPVVHKGKVKTAAACLLDMPVLKNGELVGTQLAKNIHFLGTASRDNTVPSELKEKVKAASEQSTDFYKTLYASNGYNAYRNARNFSGQKVETLMLECIAARDGNEKANEFAKDMAKATGTAYVPEVRRINIAPDTLERVKTRAFMLHPAEDIIAKGREELIVEPVKERGTMVIDKPLESMTVEELNDYERRNVLTVEQKQKIDKLKKEKNEAGLEKRDLDPHRAEKKKHSDKFKEQDVIDYMYNEWFLAGLSWLFDKAEDLADAMLDKLIDTRNQNRARRALEAHEAKDELAKETIKKIHAFEDGVDVRLKAHENKIAARGKSFENMITGLRDINFRRLSPSEIKELKNQYKPELIDKLVKKASETNGETKVSEFLDKCVQRHQNTYKDTDRIEKVAIMQVETEMIGEVMRSTGSWRKNFNSTFKTNEELLESFDKRKEQRMNELSSSVAAIRADTHLMTEAALIQINPRDTAKLNAFIEENVLSYYNTKIASASSDEEKQTALEQKDYFKTTYSSLSSHEERQSLIINTIADNKVSDFLQEQIELETSARQIQQQDREKGRYDAQDRHPQKETAEILDKAGIARSRAQKTLAPLFSEGKTDFEAQKSLYEAVFKSDKEKITEASQNIISLDEARIQERRTGINRRKQRLEEFKHQIAQENAAQTRMAPMRYGGRM